MISDLSSMAAVSGPSDVLAALRQASAKTGSDFQYLLGTAMRESSLQTQAKSTSSSATGLFQFIDQTWLGLIKRFGADHGLAQYSEQIEQGPGGRYSVASANVKAAILALRKDPEVAALMAGEAAADTKENMQGALGRDVSCGELYAAHFLGQGSACKLISLNESNPGLRADLAFPQAARANPHVFYAADGTPKTVGQVYHWAVSLPDGAAAHATGTSRVAQLQTETRPETLATNLGGAEGLPPAPFRRTHRTDEAQETAALNRLSGFRAFSSAMASLPQPALNLTPGVLEILASMDAGRSFAERQPA